MLEPRDRRLFLESLRPPEGYALDRAVGTTFTLDLRALVAAPLAFSLFDAASEDGAPGVDPLALLEAVRRQADKIHIFCQATQISVPGSNRPLLAYIEGSVVEVRAPPGGLFHPKVWLLRFKPNGENSPEPVRYRLLVMSRNLTFDRAWDTLLVLDGELADRKKAIAVNHPLGDFIQALPSMATGDVPKRILATVDQIQEEVRRVRFELPPDIEELAFRPLGIAGASRWPFTGRIDRLLVISPFVSDELLGRLADLGHRHVLVSRVDSLAQLAPETLARFEGVHVLSDHAFFDLADDGEDEHEGQPLPDVAALAADALVGLHAKVYVADAGWDARMWLGSANATDGAFGKNVEFMVELTGKKSKCGIDAILGATESGTSFRALLQTYEPGNAKPPDPIGDGLRASIEQTRTCVSDAGLVARVLPGTSARYALEIHPSAAHGLTLPEAVTMWVWPVTLGEGFAAMSVASYPAGSTATLATFSELSLPELTSFVAFHVVAVHGARTAEERFVVNLPLEGAPVDRKEALLKALIKDRRALMRYLMLLLTQAGGDVGALVGDGGDEPGAGGVSAGGGPFGGALFESLLHALDRDPKRIDDVERLVADLRKTPEGSELLPPGFDAIWVPILAARREL
jgi:hypothetical protein